MSQATPSDKKPLFQFSEEDTKNLARSERPQKQRRVAHMNHWTDVIYFQQAESRDDESLRRAIKQNLRVSSMDETENL